MDIGLDSSGVAGVPGSIPGPAIRFFFINFLLSHYMLHIYLYRGRGLGR